MFDDDDYHGDDENESCYDEADGKKHLDIDTVEREMHDNHDDPRYRSNRQLPTGQRIEFKILHYLESLGETQVVCIDRFIVQLLII